MHRNMPLLIGQIKSPDYFYIVLFLATDICFNSIDLQHVELLYQLLLLLLLLLMDAAVVAMVTQLEIYILDWWDILQPEAVTD